MSDDFGQEQAIRKLQPGKLVVASHNAGKVREIAALLGPYGIEPISAAAPAAPGADRLRQDLRGAGCRDGAVK